MSTPSATELIDRHPSPRHDAVLTILARQVDDLEVLRMAIGARIFQLTNSKPDRDGVVRGLGYPENHPDVLRFRTQEADIQAVEEAAIRQLERHIRTSPWGAWLTTAPGVGEKQFARLLGVLGDPAWNSKEGRYRTVDELYVYCGYHSVTTDGRKLTSAERAANNIPTVAPKRRKGVQSKWSEEARKRSWLIAMSCMKQRSGTKYRDIYEAARVKYEDAVHVAPCQQCAGKNKPPAEVGSPLRDGHKMSRALRVAAKAVLRDAWRESRRQHGFHVDEVVRRSA